MPLLLALAVVTLFSLSTASSADDSATVTVSLTIPVIQTLSMEQGGDLDPPDTSVTAAYIIPYPTDQDFERGWIEARGAVTLVVKSNTDWVIEVRALSEDMGGSFSYRKPVGDFRVRRSDGNDGYMTITDEEQVLAGGTNGVFELNLDYKVLLGEGYSPGGYKIIIFYRITTAEP